ncbi:hypothetical protein [Micromonospora sp. NPDC050695]|uniref:hypothetical protein n=1 Tax=Micromonospora sp. NPDC050695 TaxID=3154938 RepID=UPI0033C86B19
MNESDFVSQIRAAMRGFTGPKDFIAQNVRNQSLDTVRIAEEVVNRSEAEFEWSGSRWHTPTSLAMEIAKAFYELSVEQTAYHEALTGFHKFDKFDSYRSNLANNHFVAKSRLMSARVLTGGEDYWSASQEIGEKAQDIAYCIERSVKARESSMAGRAPVATVASSALLSSTSRVVALANVRTNAPGQRPAVRNTQPSTIAKRR